MHDQLDKVLFQYPYAYLVLLVVVYFGTLYFLLAPLFDLCCKVLTRKNMLHPILVKEPGPGQVRSEIKHSTVSILVFGATSLPLFYLIRTGHVTLLPDTFLTVPVGLILLNLWNEVHFYLIHRLLHRPFFMRHFHYIHHQSRVPTVYSVYSFHWVEAVLLSTVPLSIVPFIPFSPLAILLYPLSSVLLNYAGHCNYRFGNGQGKNWTLLGTHHNQHHAKGNINFGFALPYLDGLFPNRANRKQKPSEHE
jgi:lathosterol oxidase